RGQTPTRRRSLDPPPECGRAEASRGGGPEVPAEEPGGALRDGRPTPPGSARGTGGAALRALARHDFGGGDARAEPPAADAAAGDHAAAREAPAGARDGDRLGRAVDTDAGACHGRGAALVRGLLRGD